MGRLVNPHRRLNVKGTFNLTMCVLDNIDHNHI